MQEKERSPQTDGSGESCRKNFERNFSNLFGEMFPGAPKPETIPFLARYFFEESKVNLQELLESPNIDTGKYTKEVEEMVKSIVGAKHAVTTDDCSTALKLSLETAGVEPGDEVITTAYTYIATPSAVDQVGAQPVFADIQPDTLNIDPRDIEKKITAKTKAIMPVHFAGMPCDMDEINAIAKAHNLVVIEDAAQAFGANYHGKLVGSDSEIACFSFDSYKTVPGGRGGVAVTRRKDYAKQLSLSRYYGIDESYGRDYYKKFAVETWGEKGYLNELNGALIAGNLKHFKELLVWRMFVDQQYRESLKDSGLQFIRPDSSQTYSAHYVTPVVVGNADKFIQAMASRDVHAGLPAIRNDRAPRFGGKRRKDLPVLNELEFRIAALPTHPGMGMEGLEKVIEAVKKGW